MVRSVYTQTSIQSAQHARVYIDLYVALGYISTFMYIYSHKIVQLGVHMCLLCAYHKVYCECLLRRR